MKYQIIKPLDCDWSLFGKILRDINYDTRKILNKSIQLCWEYSGFSSNYKKLYGNYPNTKDILKYKGIDGYIYDKCKTEFNRLNTGNMSQTIKRAVDKWKNDKKEILIGDKSIPNYKKYCPIDLKNKSIQLYKEKDMYIVNLSLISNLYKKELERTSGQFAVLLKIGDRTQKAILNKLISGEYNVCASQIIYHKNKWFLNLTYQFIQEIKELDKNRILGIDLGIVNVATMQVYDINNQKYDWLKYNQCVLDGKELIHFRQSIEARRKQLSKQSKIAGEGRCGHGYNTKMKPVNKIGDKIANFRDTYNHKISKYIIEFAIKNNCGIIQMEDLSGYSGAGNSLLENWSYYDLQNKIQYKAKEKGIEVIFINPKYTSQRCNKCGFISKENRDGKNNQAKFKCVNCNHEDNADINAARNIAIPDIEDIIKEQIEKQNNSISVGSIANVV